MLEIQVENQPAGHVLVSLKGRLDTQTATQCEQRLQPLLAGATRVLVFDLAQLDYLSSMGLRVLMIANRALTTSGGKCLLARLQPSIRTVIDIANALPAQNIFASLEEADHYLDVVHHCVREEGFRPATTP